MNTKLIWARIVALFSGAPVAHVLADWSNQAEKDFDELLAYAHRLKVEAEAEIAKVAAHEVDATVALFESLERRVLALIHSGTVPASHQDKLIAMVQSVPTVTVSADPQPATQAPSAG